MKPGNAAEADSGINVKDTHLVAENVTMADFAKELARNHDIGKAVVDRTGLSGRFKFELDWLPERLASSPESIADDRSPILIALKRQLGLNLESATIPVATIVIDRAQKPDAN